MTDDDREAFRQALADAKPLRAARRAEEVIRKPAPKARFARADEMAALRESLEADIDDTESHGGESLRFHRPAVGKRTMRKLARGSFSVRAEIDLHGVTVAEAKLFLRVEHEVEDGLIQTLIAAAQAKVETDVGLSLTSTSPAPLRLAILMLVLRAYERGEAVEIEPVEGWIAPYRVVRL